LMHQPAFDFDNRPGAGPHDAWWKGDAGQIAWFIWGYESLWLPASLLEDNRQERLAEALFAGSRSHPLALHFNKGLAGAPPDAIVAAQDTAMNPAVLTAFALVIAADGQGPAYPGIPDHEPAVVAGQNAAERVDRGMRQLRALVPEGGSYVSESNYFEKEWQQSYWGSNYPRLAEIKRKYDPDGLFFVHNGVGSEQWSADGFTKL
jgi:FAD/FMN-containing dehydrogenase